MVVEPLRLPDNCLISDGGRAIIVTSLERARDLKQPPAVIMGMGQHNPSTVIAQSDWMAGPTGAKRAGEIALSMADITLDDVDACQIYDCFTYTVEITLQDYGFFGPGEGRDWLEGGTIEPGGRMPVNTSGGQLSEAYFMGLTPLAEGAMQIMGRCGQRQLGPLTDNQGTQDHPVQRQWRYPAEPRLHPAKETVADVLRETIAKIEQRQPALLGGVHAARTQISAVRRLRPCAMAAIRSVPPVPLP